MEASSSSDDDIELSYQLEKLQFSFDEEGKKKDFNSPGPSRLSSLAKSKSVDGPSSWMNSTRPQVLHEPQALKLLQEITGISNTQLTTSLYKATMLPNDHEDFKKISKYIKNSQTHGFGIQMINIIRLVRNNDFEFEHKRGHLFPKKQNPLDQQTQPVANPILPGGPHSSKTHHRSSKSNDFRMILWHGTKKQHTASIITKGFAIPPQKNQMFGKGIYFADRVSKSAQYCDNTAPGQLGYLFLCDVKLGKMYKAFKAHVEYNQSPPGFDTVKCCGKKIPDWEMNDKISGALIPLGHTIEGKRFETYTLQHNEYIIYESQRVKAKYLVVVKFHASRQ